MYKRDANNTAAWASNPIERRRFLWHGWLMLRETIEIDADADGDFIDVGDSIRTKTYTWGRDLSGSLESAGGIGGLLSVYDDNATTTGGSPSADDREYVYVYDVNGNVGQVVDWSASSASSSLKAKYEYDAYGNITASGGSYVTSNTFRFSTKAWDDESGLGYWVHRYYEPRTGRWISRDPLGNLSGEEQLDVNQLVAVYLYGLNNPIMFRDALGLECSAANGPNGCTLSPNYPLGFKFKPCCDLHDECYCTCGKSQSACDADLGSCLNRVCQTWLDEHECERSPWSVACAIGYSVCRSLASTYVVAVTEWGGSAYNSAQIDAGCIPKPKPCVKFLIGNPIPGLPPFPGLR